ncbi:DUF3558 domain-containing protein [Streptomyces sp. TRM43335]|uniref:DUF3558 domain-containing protein n=1 Tax=Streptomyces taklimakanensis TaxID=2569853 RepID=A0A6G2BDS2_9ACTN|nr:DUF3558 family protein [Streptomyces taklimakanensis]MTE20435.1 DUF3558 domain-containing protein [Streptomyces taklimakanensis]
MHRNATRTAIRTLACAAVPMLLVAGCSSDSGDKERAEPSASTSTSSAPPSPAPVKFTELPDPCKTLSKDTIKDVVPKAEESGKNLGSKDADGYGTCLWTGLDGYQHRTLTVSLKRFDSDLTLGSGAERAAEHAGRQVAAIGEDKENEKVENAPLDGVGDQATAISFETKRKNGKETVDYREQRIVAVTGNVVVVVDYEGAGLEKGGTPKAEDIREGAVKAAKDAVKVVG